MTHSELFLFWQTEIKRPLHYNIYKIQKKHGNDVELSLA